MQVGITWWPRGYQATRGHRATIPWCALVACVTAPAIVDVKADAEGWAFVTAAGDRRRREDIEGVTAVVLDVDRAEPGALERVAQALEAAGLRAAIHTTWSHAPEAPRFRVVVALTRPLDPGELRPGVRHLAALLAGTGATVDPASADPSHTWRVPSHAPGAPYEWRSIEGEPLAVDRVLVAARPGKGTAEVTQGSEGPHQGTDPESLSPCLSRAEDIGAEPDTSRSGADFREALRRVRAGASDAVIVEALLASSPKARERMRYSGEASAREYAARTAAAARAAAHESTEGAAITRSALAVHGEAGGKGAMGRLILDLLTNDGEVMRERLAVPWGDYDRPPVRTTWAAVVGDALEVADLMAPEGWRLAARLRGTRVELARRNGVVRWIRRVEGEAA